ncbi:MAG: hypothetical protein RLZ98_683 [Pseudomonadota bacterium]
MTNVQVTGKFGSDQSGAVAVIFALACIMLIGTVGLAIDGGRAYQLASKQAAVLDAAALAGAKAMKENGASDDEIRNTVKAYIDAHLNNGSLTGASAQAPVVLIDRANDTVGVELDTTVHNYFGSVLGIDKIGIHKTTTAVYSVKDVELGMMLDTSGSMNDFGKLTDLKAAVRDLVDLMMPGTPGAPKVRIGFAPYATALNAGAFADIAKGTPYGTSTVPPDTCVSERRASEGGFTDDAPAFGMLSGSKATSCPANAILPITNNKSALISTIDGYTADGATAGHLGAAWAWYLISPKWASVWGYSSQPAAYGDKKTIKSVLLMTDGMFNTEYEPDNGTSAQQVAQLCTNMKAQGVTVFTVGFQAPSEVLPTLQDCASSTSYYFDASNGSDLREAFRKIGDELVSLRIKK